MDIPLYIDTTIKSPTTIYGSNSDFIVVVSGDGMLLPTEIKIIWHWKV